MQDTYSKYIRLFGNIFFTVLAFVISLILLLLGLRLFFGLVNNLSWFLYVYLLFIISVPAALFISVYIMYWKRTKTHPKKAVRLISYCIFGIALLSWLTAYVVDIITFYQSQYTDIIFYKSYDMYFLAGNVATLFLIGILQAFTTNKEVDWMDKHRNSNPDNN